MKVNFVFIVEDDDTEPTGKKYGVECDACGDRFFDRMSRGVHPRMLESGIPIAINHANTVHQSTGGVVGAARPSRIRRLQVEAGGCDA
jgi:hypothetical protein